jgi:hypothetical protein
MNKRPVVVATAGGKLDHSVNAETPSGMPDVRVHVRPWWFRVLIRFLKVYLSSLLGLYAGFSFVPGVDDVFPLLSWGQQAAVVAQMAFVGAVPLLLFNAYTFVSGLDSAAPDLVA